MVDVILYTFSKKENSTAQPTGGTTISGVFREPSSIVNPTIMFKLNSAPTFNHAYISEFNRYYFIENWTTDHGLWIASMRVDALASWKANIGASTQYVTRSASRFDGTIIDNLYPTTNEITSHFSQLPDSPIDFRGSSYVIGVAGKDGITYYGLHESGFTYLLDAIFTNGENWLGQIDEIGEDLQKALINPMQYIVSCRWFPFDVFEYGTSVSKIKFGWWELFVECVKVNRYALFQASIPYTQHPQSASRGTYLNIAPFTRRTLFCNAFGCVPINLNTLAEVTTIPLDLTVDMFTGRGKLELYAQNRSAKPFQLEYSQFAVDVELTGSASNLGGVASGLIGTAGSVLSMFGGNTLAPIGVGSGIISSLEALTPQVKTQGTIGSTVAFTTIPYLYTEFVKVVSDTPTHRGKPLCKDVVISTLSGYITVSDPDIAFPCTAEEEREIAHYMESGFYYE